MKAKVLVRLKSGVLDPQGKAVLHAAKSLGFSGIQDVRVGKIFEIEFESENSDAVQQTLKELSDKLLANTVIEDFTVEL